MLQWKTSWECFDWNQNHCADNAAALANDWLVQYDIDFANLMQFRSEDFTPPTGWVGLSTERDACEGEDKTTLVFNDQRWSKLESPAAHSTGCLDGQVGPYVLQAFKSKDSSRNVSGIIAICAQFPVPKQRPSMDDLPILIGLNRTLAAIMNATGISNVVILADTNRKNTLPSDRITKVLHLPGRAVSTRLLRSCCSVNNFASSAFAYDRIIANFGAGGNPLMETKMLLEDPIPTWLYQERDGVKAPFHKPLLGRLPLTPQPPSSNEGQQQIITNPGSGCGGSDEQASKAEEEEQRMRPGDLDARGRGGSGAQSEDADDVDSESESEPGFGAGSRPSASTSRHKKVVHRPLEAAAAAEGESNNDKKSLRSGTDRQLQTVVYNIVAITIALGGSSCSEDD